MKSYDIVGYAQDGAMYCPECFTGDTESDDASPVFVDCCEPGDYCDACLDPLCDCDS